MPSIVERRRSKSETRRTKKLALSTNIDNSRYPAIDLRTIQDVPTSVCVEVSRAIMTRPEVKTGSLFRLVAASDNDVNKSDAIIVISAVILEAIGNSKGAQSLLLKSRTVMNFYELMNLNNENVRTSFCIMLFAIAPEFVKMIESSLKTALERVQKVTTAPHASSKMLEAVGELTREGTFTTFEHSGILDDINNSRSVEPADNYDNSIQNTPDDGIEVKDSASRLGDYDVTKDNSPLNTLGLMRYIKKTKEPSSEKFYDKFPNASRPVVVKVNNDRAGLGYRANESVVTSVESETQFTNIVNNLLGKEIKKSRKSLTEDDKRAYKESFREPRFIPANSAIPNKNKVVTTGFIDPINNQVTIDDINNNNDVLDYKMKALSIAKADTVLSPEQQDLLDCL